MDDMDCDCDLGGCECDCDGCCGDGCDCDGCCGGDDCDCDLGSCCCFGSSSDDHISVICIDVHGQGKHNEDPGCWCCYCCCEDTSKRRESTQINKAPKPEKMDKKQDEKRKKKESGSKNSLTPVTYCSCREPNSHRMPKCPRCERFSSISPSFDPPMTQRFQWPDREKYVVYNRDY